MDDGEKRRAALTVDMEIRKLMGKLSSRMERIKAAARAESGDENARLTPAEHALQRSLWWEVAIAGGVAGVAGFAAARAGGVGRAMSVVGAGLGAQAVGSYAFYSKFPTFLETCTAAEGRSALVDGVLCPTLIDLRRIVEDPAWATAYGVADDRIAGYKVSAERLFALCDARSDRAADAWRDRAADSSWGASGAPGGGGWDDAADPVAADADAQWYTPPPSTDFADDDPAAE